MIVLLTADVARARETLKTQLVPATRMRIATAIARAEAQLVEMQATLAT